MISDEQIRLLVAHELNLPIELVQPDTALATLPGFDSTQFLMLMIALEEAGIKIPLSEAANLRTLGNILAVPRD